MADFEDELNYRIPNYRIPLVFQGPVVSWTKEELQDLDDYITRQDINGSIKHWEISKGPTCEELREKLAFITVTPYFANLTLYAIWGPLDDLPILLDKDSAGDIVPHIAIWRLEKGK